VPMKTRPSAITGELKVACPKDATHLMTFGELAGLADHWVGKPRSGET